MSQKQNGSNFGSKNCVSPWSPSPLIWGDEGGDCPRAPRNQCFHIVFPPLAQTRTDLLCLFSCSETSTCSKMNAHQAAGGDPCGSIPLGPTSIPLPGAFRYTCPVNVEFRRNCRIPQPTTLRMGFMQVRSCARHFMRDSSHPAAFGKASNKRRLF